MSVERGAGGKGGLNDEAFMRAALDSARRGLAAGEAPVGACLVQDGEIVAIARNDVGAGPDPTAHAEIQLIREVCRRLRTTVLNDATVYVTIEPCPMCLAACHYAGIGRVVFGAAIADLDAVTGSELRPDAGFAAVERRGGVLAAECRALLAGWKPAYLSRSGGRA